MIRTLSLLALGALFISAAQAQEKQPYTGWRKGQVVEAKMIWQAEASTRVQEGGFTGEPETLAVLFYFEYLDRIDAVADGRVTKLTRHYLAARSKVGEKKSKLVLEGRQVTLVRQPNGDYGVSWYGGRALPAGLLIQIDLSKVPESPDTWRAHLGARSHAASTVTVKSSWPPPTYRSWPAVALAVVKAQEVERLQVEWSLKLEGDHRPWGGAVLEINVASRAKNMFGSIEIKQEKQTWANGMKAATRAFPEAGLPPPPTAGGPGTTPARPAPGGKFVCLYCGGMFPQGQENRQCTTCHGTRRNTCSSCSGMGGNCTACYGNGSRTCGTCSGKGCTH